MAELGWLYRVPRPRPKPRMRARVGVVPYLIVYAGPLACWAAMGCAATVLSYGTAGAGPSVKALLTAVTAPALEGLRDPGWYAWVVVHLALIAAFALKPRALTAGVSVLALFAWLAWGVVTVTLGW